jgi:hypothetical protein
VTFVAQRTLPTVIGPTENSLRSLLQSILTPSDIHDDKEWAYLNLAAGGAPPSDVLTTMGITSTELRAIHAELGTRGLIDGRGELTPSGLGALAQLRPKVAEMTERVMAGIDDADAQVSVRVLDEIRRNACLTKAEVVRR